MKQANSTKHETGGDKLRAQTAAGKTHRGHSSKLSMTATLKGAQSTRALSTAAVGTSKRRNIPTSKENVNPNIVMQQNLMNDTAKQPTKKPKLPAYMQSLNQMEKAENFKIIDSMNKKISYKKNPRFKINKAPIFFTKEEYGNMQDKTNPFRVEPQVVQFTNYQVNGVYQIPLRIINGSEILQRIKISPPTTTNFTVTEVIYPNDKTGDIAPGLAMTVLVNFVAPSFADFDDHITVITENNSFKVPVRARRDPPLISLANPMNCLHSWVGDRVDMAFRCVNSGGDGGFKFFCERDEDDQKQMDPNVLKIGSFTLNPAQFYLHAGNAIDIYVSFTPDKEGQTTENLILACDNNTSESFQVTGNGAMLDVAIVEVDGRPIDFKVNPFSSLQFPNTNPTAITQRRVKVKNFSPILVPYHWSIFKNKNSNKITLEDDPTHYRIEPAQGKIQAGHQIEFILTFKPDHAEPYFEYCDFIIEDLPIQSVRDPPEALKSFIETAKIQTRHLLNNPRIPMPQYVGSNAQFLSIPLLNFALLGQGNSCQVTLEPAILNFEGDLYLGEIYRETVKLKKQYKGKVYYKLGMEGKSSPDLDIEVTTQGKNLRNSHEGVITGEIRSEDDEISIEVAVKSRVCGEQLVYFYIEIADGAPITFQVRGNFRGPRVRVIDPVIDFGLVKVNTQNKFRLTIENSSPIPATILVKSVRNTGLTFDTLLTQRTSRRFRETKTLELNCLKFADDPEIVIQANCRVELLLQLETKKPESFAEYFEILVNQAPESVQYFQVLAEIQKPLVCLNKERVNLGRIYAGVAEKINADKGERNIVMVNYGNIPAQFLWEEKYDQERVIARFEPMRGVIPPKSEVRINVNFLVYYGGKVDELLTCSIEDIEIPLGIEFHAESFGLNVQYEISEPLSSVSKTFNANKGSAKTESRQVAINGYDSLNQSQDMMNKSLMSLTKSKDNDDSYFNPNESTQIVNSANILRQFKFDDCMINKVSTQKFILKNISGIKTKFKFFSETFEPLSHEAPQVKSEIEKARDEELAKKKQGMNETSDSFLRPSTTTMNGKQIRFAPSTKSGATHSNSFIGRQSQSAGEHKREKPILSDEHEATAKFSSATGNTFTQTKKLEKEANFFLSNNKGIAIVIKPHIGELPPHSEIPVTVLVYNNVCGKFTDKIISQVRGLETIQFPIQIGIKGSPVEIPANQVGLNYNTSPPTLPLPSQVVNTGPITKSLKIRNTGIRSIDLNWKIFDRGDIEKSENNIFNVEVAQNLGLDALETPYKFNFDFVEPQESQNSVFEINPKTCMMGPRETQTFTVTFYPNKPGKGTGKFRTLVLAQPELTQEELAIADDAKEFSKKGSLGLVAFNIYSESIDPQLTIDKRTRVDHLNHILFKYWSYRGCEEAPSAIQRVIYTNETKSDLVFNLVTNGPFEIVKTKTNTNAKHPKAPELPIMQAANGIKKSALPPPQTYFCLQPLKILEIGIKFKAPSSLNTTEWPLIISKEASGSLSALFNNGDSQKLQIDAKLLRPMLILLTDKPQKNVKAQDELQFGTVHVDAHKTIRIFLSNVTDVTAKWKLNYVSFPKKASSGYMTQTLWEKENVDKVDDPDVFQFSMADGSLRGKSLPLRKLPEGLCVPPNPRDEEEKKYLPHTILINFKPKKNVLYKSKFRFTVENGISCDVILKGFGSYEEQYNQ